MKSKTKQLIKELKEEIDEIREEVNKKYSTLGYNKEELKEIDTILDRILQKQAQLQFAKKLIKAIRGDVEKLKEPLNKWNLGLNNQEKLAYFNGYEDTKQELNKILDEALK